MTYQVTAGNGNFGTLSALSQAGLINMRLGSGEIHGYVFNVTTQSQTDSTPAFFAVSATPRNYRVTGIRSFYIDSSGVLRGADKQGQPADQNDPPIEN